MFGKLDPDLAPESELRGQALFFGKAQCAACHPPPYYPDNSMPNLRTERCSAARIVNGARASADGPIKTFPLRGIKESPPYLHGGRLMTLEDPVEFCNLVLVVRRSQTSWPSCARCKSRQKTPPLLRAGLVLGIGLGGIFDGIVLHQMLGWHHLICKIETWATDSIKDLRR